eukprot:Skav203371  [mRNA]  locus=scaffold940:374825:376898:- [translate_table: standard]
MRSWNLRFQLPWASLKFGDDLRPKFDFRIYVHIFPSLLQHAFLGPSDPTGCGCDRERVRHQWDASEAWCAGPGCRART